MFDEFLNGELLFDDDFNFTQIKQWYNEEEEAYAQLEGKGVTQDNFEYTKIDQLFGFPYIDKFMYKEVLGFGASWGYEFISIIEKIVNLTIIDSSENTRSSHIYNVVPKYIKANMSGKIDVDDNHFNLITAFSVLHHIPNVSFVINELIRVLSQDGILLIREPIHSMGDWSTKRNGLTKNERGIHYLLLQQIIEKAGGKIVRKSFHFFMYSFLKRFLGNPSFLNKKWYLRIDNLLSNFFLWNFYYHPQKRWQRIAPQMVYLIIKKKQT